jgi:uncharacterized cofD-like protein
VKLSSEVLASLGRIYPSTDANVMLEAELENGRVIAGETRISKSRARIKRIRMRPRVCKPLPETLEAIEQADLITMGPGSLFTSVIPNVLVRGIPEAIRRSHALCAYFVNLMWQPGETIGFLASDHVAAINRHAGFNLFDVVVVNTRSISARQRRKYAAEEVQSVVNDIDRLAGMGLHVVTSDLLGEGEIVRHDPRATAEVAMELARRGRGSRRKIRILNQK